MSGLFGGGPKAAGAPPAIGALNVQQSSFAVPVQLVYGTNRLEGNLIWYSDFVSTPIPSAGGGGKGGVVGGGGKGGGSSGYNYNASIMIGLCEGPITGVGQVWVTKQITSLPTLNGVLFTGTADQLPWGYLTTKHPLQADPYHHLAYAGFANFSLGTSAETPQFSFEIQGLEIFGNGIPDASPDDVIEDFLERSNFPVAYIGSMTQFRNYCQAMGFFISPVLVQQRQAFDWLNEWMATLNSEFVWSNGQLTVVPYADSAASGNGVTFSPNMQPQYNLNDNHFIVNGDEDPVKRTRKDLGDLYNQVPIEYVNRADQYNIESYIAEDLGHVDMFGARQASTVQAHHITDPNVAQQIAYLYLWRQLYIRTTYSFKLPWNFARLDPMDIVSITDANLQLVNSLVRITDIDEDEQTGTLTITAEEIPGAVSAAALYNTISPVRYTADYNQDPGTVNPPVIFEAPLALVQAASIEVYVAVSGILPQWGGCNIYSSTDGETYSYLQQYNSKSRQGLLTANLPTFDNSTGSIDLIGVLSIDMTESAGQLNNSATPTDATNLNTLCYVDGELIAYGNDVLTAPNKYNLTYLNRGCYGSPIAAHAASSQFARVDSEIIVIPIDQSRIGQTLYLKFVSFNHWGGGIEEISTVAAYTYKILGTALLTPLASPTNLAVNYTSGIAQLNWTAITDIRSPVFYQIRKGATFNSAQIVGNTTQANFAVYGSDTYWVTALYFTPLGVAVYSAAPPSVAITTPSIQQYLIETWEESTPDGHGVGPWGGTLGGGAAIVGPDIELTVGNILGIANVLVVPNVLAPINVSSSGSYTAPVSHRITSNYVMNAKIIFNWTLAALSVLSDVTAITDVPTTADITGLVSSSLVYGIPQIRLSTDGGATYGEWQNWTPGVYTFNAVDYRILLYTLENDVTPVLSQYSIEADVPELTQTGSQITSGGGTVTVTFPLEYNTLLTVTPSIVNAVAGDLVVMGTPTLTGFTIEVVNAGSPVIRTVQWTAIGY